MRVFHGFDDLPRFVRPVVTVGSYDGVHTGHRKLIGEVVRMARSGGGESVVVTFWPHPRTVLAGCGKGEKPVELLSMPGEKAFLLASLGVDNLIVAPFTKDFSRLSPADFVRGYLVNRIGVDHLVVGFNHHFGRNHEGGLGDLVKLGAECGFALTQISEQDVGRSKVSSTIVRDLIRRGEMTDAAGLLGAPYIIMWPPGEGKLLPPPGNYPVRVGRDGGHCKAVLSISLENAPALIRPSTAELVPNSSDAQEGRMIIEFMQ